MHVIILLHIYFAFSDGVSVKCVSDNSFTDFAFSDGVSVRCVCDNSFTYLFHFVRWCLSNDMFIQPTLMMSQ